MLNEKEILTNDLAREEEKDNLEHFVEDAIILSHKDLAELAQNKINSLKVKVEELTPAVEVTENQKSTIEDQRGSQDDLEKRMQSVDKQIIQKDKEIKKVQEEASKKVQEVTSEKTSSEEKVEEKSETAKVLEVKQQTPEELKKERRMDIIKEIEEGWEAQNGPMHRSMTRSEIDSARSWEEFNGRNWDGTTTRLTEEASEFFFDHSGKGKNSVPSRADKILAERFPEYAQKTEQTPEELKKERRMDIIKEIEEEWEAQNGLMHIPMTKSEIESASSWEEFNGRNWDGTTTRLTEEASEFFFDHSGKGKNSVPSRADKILAERFPEYAQKTEQTPETELKKAEKKIAVAELSNPDYGTEKTSSENLTEVFKQAGIESRTIKIENNGEFPEVIILEKQELPTEKMIRIYRGINHLDSSVLEQIPYAMRKENTGGKPIALENVRQEVNNLAKNPTYENLLTYTDKVRENLSADEARRMEDDLSAIEDGIMEGDNTRQELIYKQIGHGGGWGKSGITPYISASFDPYQAAGYGREALIVIDVPLSELEYFSDHSGEVNIKGALDKKYITAILPRKRREAKDDEEKINQQVDQALQRVYELAEIPLYSDEEMRSERETKRVEETESDNEQQKKDVERVWQKRVEKLAKLFPEMRINFQDAKEKSSELQTDPYTQVKTNIFDHYKNRFERIGRNGINIEDYDFSESEYGERKKFDREKTSDIMLIKLREITLRLEEREKNRNKR